MINRLIISALISLRHSKVLRTKKWQSYKSHCCLNGIKFIISVLIQTTFWKTCKWTLMIRLNQSYLKPFIFLTLIFFFISSAADSRRKPRQTAACGFKQEVKELQQAAQHWGLLQDLGQRHSRAPREQRHGAQRGGKPDLCCLWQHHTSSASLN